MLHPEGVVDSAIERAEVEVAARVYTDLREFVDRIANSRSAAWLTYRDRDLAATYRRPDEAIAGFLNQALAFSIALSERSAGETAFFALDAFQRAGLEAALSRKLPTSSVSMPSPRAAFRAVGSRSRHRGGDILYLSLEPHVALQQDRVLRRLSETHRVVAMSTSRTPWPWPAKASFQPAEHVSLVSMLETADLTHQAVAWMRRKASRALPPPPSWMGVPQARAWVSRLWWRAARASDAMDRALAFHRPRLMVGTNLASGIGTVMSAAATRAGVPVLSLPSGADYLLPPSFDPADTGLTNFVVPEVVRAAIHQSGADTGRLFACGWPEMDEIDASMDRRTARAILGLATDRPLIAFFSSPSNSTDELVVPRAVRARALSALAEACRAEDVDLVVKLHPRETDGDIERRAAEFAPSLPVLRDRTSHLLAAADGIASVGSAVSFAAAHLGKPAGILEASSVGRTAALFEALRVASPLRSAAEIRAFVRQAIRPASTPPTSNAQGPGDKDAVASSIVRLAEGLLE